MTPNTSIKAGTEVSEGGRSNGLEDSFNWLSREARGSAYISYTEHSHKAACSFDFGEEGYAASCNDGGKLLHMSAKSQQNGIIFAQGNFESTLYSSLARAQRSYVGLSTFGLELPVSPQQYDPDKRTGSAIRLGEMIERGSFNHRWPFNEYALISNFHAIEDDESECDVDSGSVREGDSVESIPTRSYVTEQEVGTCAVLSFIKDGVLYQILRFEASTRWEADECPVFPYFGNVILEVGSPMKFRNFDQSSKTHTAGNKKRVTPPCAHAGDHGPEELPHRTLFVDGNAQGISLGDCWSDPAFELDIRVTRLGSGDNQHSDLTLQPTSDNNIGYFQGEAELKYDKLVNREARSGRTVTFMASFRLRDKTESSGWPDIPTSEDIYKHIGISSSEPIAVGAMWETIFAQRERLTGRISELSEGRLVARCLEKILHVDLVPTPFGKIDKRRYPAVNIEKRLLPISDENHLEAQLTKRVNEKLEQRLSDVPVALVSNLFLQPNVDLKAMFWKVRFLVKAYEFLRDFAASQSNVASDKLQTPGEATIRRVTTQALDRDEDPDIEFIEKDLACMKYAAYYQLQIIRNRIELVVEYLFQALLQPDSDTPLLPDNVLAFEPNYYYAMMTLCYVSKKTQRFKFSWPSANDMNGWDKANSTLYRCLPDDNANFNPDFKDKVLLLKWYHYGSMRELCKGRFIPASWMHGIADNTVYRLKRDAVRAAKAKLSSNTPYVAEDEILDRLGFLAWPLGLEDRVSSDYRPATLASITAKRIRERDFTREVNPGTSTSSSSGLTCGPWEIHALCHHSRLMVSNYLYMRKDGRSRDEKMQEVESYRERLCDFITAESSVVPCWERTDLATRRGWLRSEATSVLGATLLEICQKDFGLLQEERRLQEEKRLGKESKKQEAKKPTITVDDDDDDAAEASKPKTCPRSCEEERQPGLDWKLYCPPSRYHPEDFFISLEDTPELYRYARLQKREVPANLRAHLSGAGLRDNVNIGVVLKPMMGTEFSKETVLEAISTASISMIDLTAQKSEQFEFVNRKASHQYRVRTAGMLRLLASEDAEEILEGPVRLGQVSGEEGKKREYERVTRRLSDSLVDKGVQHRILRINSSKHKSLVAHFVYVFHPESADAFSDNIFKTSRFSCKNRGVWATNITLRSWSFARTAWSFPNKPCEYERPIFGPTRENAEHCPEDEPIHLPTHLHEALEKLDSEIHDTEDKSPGHILLNASSIVLSTNEFGDFSKCSIISKLITQTTLLQLEKEVPKLWQRFIHQPQTGRCLVFLLLLGQLCQAIAQEHHEAINHLTSIMNIENYFLRGEKDWLKDDDAIRNLQLALWILESLYKLRNTLEGSLATIDEAKAVLLAQIHKGPGKRSAELESFCQSSIESFERNVCLLSALHIKIKRKTELGGRYRDSLSIVLSLNDSRNSLLLSSISADQSTTIQKLTYLTIAYLPVGLTAAIFAIPDEQKVVVPAMGRNWFVGCILILFFFTFVIAVLMGKVLELLEWIRTWFWRVWKLVSKPSPKGADTPVHNRWVQVKSSNLPWNSKKKRDNEDRNRPGSQNESIEGLNPVESSTKSSLARSLTHSLTRRISHVDDIEAGNAPPKNP
ncbi:hypothetical protein DL98DRAFT_659605 [Cadophora sp. DSE1049]|nr:hypothetical protein DL98DRAFT_659605 [Cadophora sp. DSE1049]